MDDWKNALLKSTIPERMHGGITRWIESGVRPGHFLCAVLRNDLFEACSRADDDNRPLIWVYVSWLYNNAPGGCWGSPERFDSWAKAHEEKRRA